MQNLTELFFERYRDYVELLLQEIILFEIYFDGYTIIIPCLLALASTAAAPLEAARIFYLGVDITKNHATAAVSDDTIVPLDIDHGK
ncbi:unnamed protein product [Parnassius mnemosyne]|uniref:Uncharacterized protein n=1 Tax=Parnassius mnemosyne TaxID=213953 RepID=A0AAV1L1I3_9NEOP